ncbi:secretion protein EspO [Escherichia coli]|uniref:Secretion protein EspO n=1 Tax=Escherichia coli TaxID=562 RepID=A0A826J4H2_ECOLX|nr:secretion protein EspO [Escherichia coli]EFA4421138.1 secretion protein EspO [Escherichia coli]
MPLPIGSLFSRGFTPKLEISGPIVDNATPKNCTLISSTCNVDGIVVINRRSCSYDMRPPGAGERQPLLKMSASEARWLSEIITNEMKNSN